ncbi:MAG: preprotein translocase subunit SecE [Burkholderiales bacterium]|nr:preprotein translocase subunit SecE [Burkholderiales bacterium]
MLDKIKLAIAFIIVIAGIWGFYQLGASPMIARVGAILGGIVVALALAWTTEQGKRFYAYTQDAITETKKVAWPTRKETMQSTGVVVAFVIVMAVFLWIVDALLAWIVELMIGSGGV